MHEGHDREQAVLFADLAGFTALTEAHGDLDAADVADRFCTMVRALLPEDARVVKTIGDAVMVASTNPRSAVDIAIEILRAIGAEPRFPTVRIGLHAGPVITREDDVFGATVNLAARLAAHAHAGEILTTAAVVAALDDGSSVRLSSLGDLTFKHVSEAVEVFSIEDPSITIDTETTDPVCRMIVDADDAPARLPYGDHRYFFCSFGCAQRFAANPDYYVEGLREASKVTNRRARGSEG